MSQLLDWNTLWNDYEIMCTVVGTFVLAAFVPIKYAHDL